MPIMAAATQRPSESVDTNGVVTFVVSAVPRSVSSACGVYICLFSFTCHVFRERSQANSIAILLVQ